MVSKLLEVWKKIPDYENYYEVSNLGNVRTIKGELLKKIDNKGYDIVYLKNKIFNRPIQVHRLVALAFIENKDNKPIVNHIDGNKRNNCVDNLEWVTESENRKHAVATGLINPTYARKEVYQYDLANNFIKKWDSVKDVVDYLGISRQRFNVLFKQNNGIVKNYKWKY